MQIKTTMRYHFISVTPTSIVIIKKTKNNRCWRGWEKNGTIVHKVNWCNNCGKKHRASSENLKIELSYDPVILFLSIYLKKTTTLTWKDICTLLFSAALFTTAKLWKQRKCPLTDEWINKLWAHSSVPAWESAWTEEPSRLQSTGSQRVGHS